jgi:hypothetical protein
MTSATIRRRLAVGSGTMVVALVVGILPASVATAQEVSVTESARVLGRIEHQRIRIRLNDGAIARGNVVRYPEGEPGIELRPKLARGRVAGLERFDQMAVTELGRGALVGTNGGYWSRFRPNGAPNGLHIEGGRLIAGDASGLRGDHSPRASLGIRPGGTLVMDRLRTTLTLDLPDGTISGGGPINEINRQVRTTTDETRRIAGELLVYDDLYGVPIAAPAGSIVLTVDGLKLGSSGRSQGSIVAQQVLSVATPVTVPPGKHVLVAYGDRLPALDGLVVGNLVGITTAIAPYNSPAANWDKLTGGLAGGQLLVQNGARRSLEEWRSMNFGESHITSRQPRTAVGRSADGRALLVTIDGRQTGWSVGMTVRELADTMIRLGAVEAVNLDGGGSTTMTIDGRIQNRPSEVGRSVASGLFVYVQKPAPSRSLDRACPPGGVPPAGFADVPGTTHASSIDCLAWWKVTSGVTPATFAPSANVTRAQMASFLAKWIDDLSARGSGRALPRTATLRFTDVSPTNVHANSIARLDAAGILTGRSPTSFQPVAAVSRAQTATLVKQALEYVAGSALPAGRDTFVDDNGSVHEKSIDVLAGVGVVAGTGGFAYQPAVPVSRGAMASLIMRGSDLAIEQGLTTTPR